jgi:hypothetical protein
VKSKALKERKITQDFSVEYIYRNDREFIETAKEWISVQQQLKNLQEQESQIKNKLLQITQEQPTKCNFLKIFKTHRQGNIDYTQISELKNVDLEKYRKNSTSFWRISYELGRH